MSNEPSYLSYKPTDDEFASHRHDRVASTIENEFNRMLQRECVFSVSAMVTVTKIDVSMDYQWADLWVSVFPHDLADEVFNDLQDQVYFLQQHLNRKLRMRHTPKFRFHIDETNHNKQSAAETIDELIGDEREKTNK